MAKSAPLGLREPRSREPTQQRLHAHIGDDSGRTLPEGTTRNGKTQVGSIPRFACAIARGEFVVKRPSGSERAPDDAGAMHIRSSAARICGGSPHLCDGVAPYEQVTSLA